VCTADATVTGQDEPGNRSRCCTREGTLGTAATSRHPSLELWSLLMAQSLLMMARRAVVLVFRKRCEKRCDRLGDSWRRVLAHRIEFLPPATPSKQQEVIDFRGKKHLERAVLSGSSAKCLHGAQPSFQPRKGTYPGNQVLREVWADEPE